MDRVKKRTRVMAVLFGIAIIVILMIQIWRDGRHTLFEKAKTNFQPTTK